MLTRRRRLRHAACRPCCLYAANGAAFTRRVVLNTQPAAHVPARMQVVRLWYPYFTLQECVDLVATAPSANAPPAEEALPGSTWQEEDIAAMRREFAAMDFSGDGTVDRHVRASPAVTAPCVRGLWTKASVSCVAVVSLHEGSAYVAALYVALGI